MIVALNAWLAALLPQDLPRLQPVVVEGRADSLVGVADSASQGVVGQEELSRRPLLRPGEVLETVPGVVITQHSGAGKSNQQFARGFNLDHGTDLATSLFGMPLNMPSHGHGQGYTDLGLLIPELVDTVSWRLGPYDARDGDFASVGSIDIDYRQRLDRGFSKVTVGSYGFARTVLADSYRVGDGELLAALELQSFDGRFTVDQDYQKKNGFVSWAGSELRVSGFAYDSEWTASDQIPRRAVRSGALGRFDSLDPSSGGSTEWYGIVAEWSPPVQEGELRVVSYLSQYQLDLFSNFTYALDDRVNGDQFEQRDSRTTYGFDGRRTWQTEWGTLPGRFTMGLELRGDHVHNGLHRSQTRTRFATVRNDRIDQHALGAYVDLGVDPLPWLRGHIGGRADQYWFDVDSDLDANSGMRDAGILSGKLGVVVGPFADTEFYLNAGTGFHSNDARGVLLRDDPATAAVGDGTAVDPLVRSRGAELGLRTTGLDGLQSTVSVWALELDSELVFVGDAGATEPSRASRRCGIEWANHWRPIDWLACDLDVAWARSRFRGDDPAGSFIPGTVPLTIAAGIAVDWHEAWQTSLRVRHLDNRPLIEDGSAHSSSTTLVNARAAWQIDDRKELALDVLNLLDRQASDIEYFYDSQLPGESQPVADVHFHPVEPFTLRVSFVARF